MVLAPWRKKKHSIAEHVRLVLQVIADNIRVRIWWNPTYQEFKPLLQKEETSSLVQWG